MKYFIFIYSKLFLKSSIANNHALTILFWLFFKAWESSSRRGYLSQGVKFPGLPAKIIFSGQLF